MKAFHYTEVEAQPVEGLSGVTIRWAIGQNVGAPNFVTRVLELEPGASTEYHEHAWEHEVFLLEGEGAVRDAQGSVTTVGPGTCVYIAPNEVHQFMNRGDSTLRFLCIIPNPSQD